MKIKAKEVKRRIGILTDPNPTFVSLVDHGANQTPFNSVKRDKITSKNQPPKEQKMSLKAGKGAARKSTVVRLTFSKSLFKTEKAVQQYLDKKGYEEVDEIEDGDDVWIVNSTEDTSGVRLGKAKSTATNQAGVTAFIAEILGKRDAAQDDDDDDGEDGDDDDTTDASDDDDDSDDADGDDDGDDDTDTKKRARAKVVEEPAKKGAKAKPKAKAEDVVEDTDTVLEFPLTASGTQKFDWWASYMSNEGDLRGVLADGIGYDDVPPGVDTIVQAAHWTIGNILGDADLTDAEKKAKLDQLGSDISELTFGLYDLFSGALDVSSKSSSAKRFAQTFQDSIDAAQEITLPDDEDGDGNVTKAKSKAKPTAKRKTGTSDDNEGAEDEADTGNDIDAVLSAIKGVEKRLNQRIGSVERKATQAAKAAEQHSRRTPSRKSIADAADDLVDDNVDDETDHEAEEERREARKRDLGGLFGIVPSTPNRSGS